MDMANPTHIYTPSASTPSASTVTITGNPPLTSGTNSMYTTNNTNAITINGMSANTLSYYDGFDGKGSIKIGGQELDGDRLRKLDALLSALDSLEDDNAIKELYNIQLMLNKIKGRK
jgi:hypothetical protein